MRTREELEALLKESEERFKFLSEFSSDWYWEQDADFRFTRISRSDPAEDRFPKELSIGKARWELPYEGMTEEKWEEHRTVLRAHQPFHNYVLKRRDTQGVIRYTSLSGAPLFDAANNFLGYRGIGRDITEQKRAEQRELLEHVVARLLSEFTEPEEVLPKIVQAICQTLEWDYGAYWAVSINNETGPARHAYEWHAPGFDAGGFVSNAKEAILSFLEGSTSKTGGVIGRVMAERGPVWIEDLSSDPTFSRAQDARKVGLRSAFAFPAVVNQKVYAVIECYSRELHSADSSLLRSLRSIGRLVGLLCHRKQLEKRQAMEHDITRLLAGPENMSQAMPMVMRTICETLGWDFGAYWGLDDAKLTMRCLASWNSPALENSPFIAHVRTKVVSRRPPSEGLQKFILRAWNDKSLILVPDLNQNVSSHHGRLAADAGLRTGLLLPVLIGGEVAGVLEFFYRGVRPTDQGLYNAIRSIGAQIGQFYQRQQAEEQIRQLAYYDGLTGLANRILFNERLRHALAIARRQRTNFCILFIDLDRFKTINDTIGHEIGDKLLRAVATRFQDCLRESDTVARLGGDEFVVLLEGLGSPDAIQVAKKINRALSMPYPIEGNDYHITASIGIAAYPEDGDDVQSLMKHADIAMYQAKDKGKNNYQLYSALSNNHSSLKLTLEFDLRQALDREELLLYYQPKVDSVRGHITGMEALLRWKHPKFGLVPPSTFIPIAEETGLIISIGRWVLKAASIQNVAWQEQGLPAVPVSVNLSPRQFADDNLVSYIAQALQQSGLHPGLLDLEVTESSVVQNPVKAAMLLNDLRKMGTSISIDDFGTGYSSLSQLKDFPISTIKIDKSFVSDIEKNDKSRAITEAILALGKALGLKVVAEGVETTGQASFLRDHQCDEMQGFLFSRPIAAGEFAHLLSRDCLFEA